MRRSKKLAAVVEGLELRRLLATITVTSTADGNPVPNDGAVTLREAIAAINAGNDLGDPDITAQNPAATDAFGTNDTIKFDIPGSGVQTIDTDGNPYYIQKPVAIDGYSQTGASANTLAVGDNAKILIKLDGLNGGSTADAIDLSPAATGSSIRGLDIVDYISAGIESEATKSTFAGNFIGLDADGITAGVNLNFGLEMDAANDTIGGIAAADRNVISCTLQEGIFLQDPGGPSTVIEGNYIGTDASGTVALPNAVGIVVNTATNTIGGTAAGAGNLISGNTGDGIDLDGTGNLDVSQNTIQGNFIGTNAAGTAALPNGSGVSIVSGAQDNTVGGTIAAARNVISGNGADGVSIIDPGSNSNLVQGNYIGTNAAGTAALGNTDEGVNVTFASSMNISGNVISGNEDGIYLTSSSSNTLQGNLIGVLADGVTPAGNTESGIYLLSECNQNIIGGAATAEGNVIANNGDRGIVLSGGTGETEQNLIRLNSIFNNTGLGIDLQNSGTANVVRPNDPGDADDGPNGLQNYPVIANASYTASSVTVGGTFNSLANTNFTLDFYANDTIDPSGNGEGKQYIGSVGLTTDGNGNATFNSTFSVAIGVNKYISSTATNASTAPYADTSEFSQTAEAIASAPSNPTPPTPPMLSINDVTHDEKDSGTHTFTFTVTRSGDTSGTSDVFYSTSNGSATAGSDYIAIPLTALHFAANQSTAQIVVTENGDTTFESDETFFVNLSNPTNATITDGTGVGTILNDDAPPPPPAPKVAVVTDPCDSTKTALEIDDTDASDTITVTKSGSSQGKAVVKINGSNKGTFSFTGGIVVNGKGGNDSISIDSGITRSAYIYGGDGNDTINGGGGNDIIFGQGNDDSLNGNGGRDILVGGDGTDKLNGGNGDDLLIAGDFKSAPTMAQLCSIQKEWTRTDKAYSYRVSHLTNGGGYNTIKLNSSTLFSSTTLKDSLTGGADSDLFFAAMTGDKITDKGSGETAVNIG